MADTEAQYERFTPHLMWQEVAPHTWPAAILPVLTAFGFATIHGFATHWSLIPSVENTPFILMTVVWALLAICILMQSSVNVFNDYYDYIKGVDTIENSSDDVTDAVLVYNHINPRSVLFFAVGMLVAAFGIGIYIIIVAGWVPLILGIIGAVIVALYSAGKTPISYFPVGELISGFVMGGLITFACYYVLTGTLSWMILVYSLPCVIGIALIMLTNNTCDIEKDIDAHRKTLPVVLGHDKALSLYHCMLAFWLVAIVVLSVAALFVQHADILRVIISVLIAIPFMLLIVYPQMRALWRNPMTSASRDAAMPQILSVNITLGLSYIVMVIGGNVLLL